MIGRLLFQRPCKDAVSQAALPGRPIDKSVADAGLLAHIVVSKTQDHLPLYRQEKIFARHGLDLSRATMNNWMEKLTAYCKDGRILIDNNPVENQIRPAALGRKNWLFIGHPDAGWRAGVFYTLMANCNMRRINHFHYMRQFLEAVPRCTNHTITEWLPGHYCERVKEQSAVP